MPQSIGQVAVVVRDYDEALSFYIETLGFSLVEDTYVPEQDKRWVVISPPGAKESRLLLARAANGEQATRVGNRPEDGFSCSSLRTISGATFARTRPRASHSFGSRRKSLMAPLPCFQDLYGNLWDLLQPRNPA
jgi:catechol 2,3-dioxygenase-like lactoylglutathione lyase family enzyme